MGRRWILLCTFVAGLALFAALGFENASGSNYAWTTIERTDTEDERAMLEWQPPSTVSTHTKSQTAGLKGRIRSTRSGPVNVLVVNEHGRPVPRVQVNLIDALLSAETDEHGVAHFDEDLPHDGSLEASIGSHTTLVRGPKARLLLKGWRPLKVRVVDAETGIQVLALSKTVGTRLDITTCCGWVAWDRVSLRRQRSVHAEEFEVIAPLRREVPLCVTVFDYTGAISHGAELTVEIASKRVKRRVECDAYGTRHVRRVPYFRGERLTVIAAVPGTTISAKASAVLGPDPDGAVELQIRLPKHGPVKMAPASDLDGLSDRPFRGPPSGSPIGGWNEPELSEHDGVRRELEVVDENGEPLPFARIELWPERSGWIDVRDGVQRLDRFTDHQGRRTLARMSRRIKDVTVSWGSRWATVDVGEAKTGTLRIVLPRKDP